MIPPRDPTLWAHRPVEANTKRKTVKQVGINNRVGDRKRWLYEEIAESGYKGSSVKEINKSLFETWLDFQISNYIKDVQNNILQDHRCTSSFHIWQPTVSSLVYVCFLTKNRVVP